MCLFSGPGLQVGGMLVGAERPSTCRFFCFSPFPSLYAVVLVKVRDSGVLSKHYKIVENFGFRGGEKNKRGDLTFQLTWHMRCRIAAL
jgi:hypothetical protein